MGQTDGWTEGKSVFYDEPDRTEGETGHAETDSFPRPPWCRMWLAHPFCRQRSPPLSPSSSSLHPSLHQSGLVRSTEPSLFSGSGKRSGNGGPARSHATAAAATAAQCVCVFSHLLVLRCRAGSGPGRSASGCWDC